MEARELRIGNWVKFEDDGEIKPLKIEYIGKDSDGYKGYFAHFRSVSCTLEDHFNDGDILAKPIPLTEDILIKAGFEIDFDTAVDLNKSGLKIHKAGGRWGICTYGGQVINPGKQYLHQLQNLYYSLTGEELDITL